MVSVGSQLSLQPSFGPSESPQRELGDRPVNPRARARGFHGA